jgi:hypothetical protein
MSTLEFYDTRAAACRAEAASSQLQNVRQRCLTAASAWDEMADRARRGQTYRVEDAARKVAEGRQG